MQNTHLKAIRTVLRFTHGACLLLLQSGSPVWRFSLLLSTILFFGLNVRAFLRIFAAPKPYGLCLVLPHFGGLMRERGGGYPAGYGFSM